MSTEERWVVVWRTITDQPLAIFFTEAEARRDLRLRNEFGPAMDLAIVHEVREVGAWVPQDAQEPPESAGSGGVDVEGGGEAEGRQIATTPQEMVDQIVRNMRVDPGDQPGRKFFEREDGK